MRPLRLELEGFTAYRERAEIDFSGADLFVFSGATGAGKSSLIDAMGFALYGSVPRYNDPKLVHPVISQGKLEARVRFDFAVDGRTYSAVRVVRRTKQGASTREARLESEGRVLAGSAGELDREIRKLFGLSFDQFTTCVVLPQGQFARFLHDKPAERQDLLKELLGLRLYDRIRQLASARESAHKQQIARLEGQLQHVATATPESRRNAGDRLVKLNKLRATIEKSQVGIDELQRECAELESSVARHEREATLLEGSRTPQGLPALGRDQALAAAELSRGESAREEAEKETAGAELARAKLAPLAELEAQVRAHTERAERASQLEAVLAGEEVARRQFEKARVGVETARTSAAEALARLATIERSHAAHALASGLAPGDPCPVCSRPLEARPEHSRPPGLDAAQKARDFAEQARIAAEGATNEAMRAHVRCSERVTSLRDELARLDERVGRAPGPGSIEKALQAIAAAEERIEKSRLALRAAHQAEQAARRKIEQLAGSVSEAWQRLDAERDRLASCGPPAADREDLVGSWSALARWAAEQAKARRVSAEAVSRLAQEAARKKEAALAGVETACREAGVVVGKDRPGEALIREVARAESELSAIDQALEAAKRIAAELSSARSERVVAHDLALHLAAGGFERWLLQEAFHRLVTAGGERLRDLTGGDYSLQLDDRLNFEILDHRNADEPRSVRTLSGGETFLASLALALALADQVSELAEGGAARLESMFLDEGFGALDADTLETVATTIEELGARGRVVGLVTHVRELAERIPVQFRVSKGPTTAVVEKVVA